MELAGIGKILLLVGGIIVLTGLIIMLVGKTGMVGRLPGDILIQRGNFIFYFPLLSFII